MVLSQELGFIANSTNTVESPDVLYSPIDEENARIKRRYHIREADFYDNVKLPEEKNILKRETAYKSRLFLSNCYFLLLFLPSNSVTASSIASSTSLSSSAFGMPSTAASTILFIVSSVFLFLIHFLVFCMSFSPIPLPALPRHQLPQEDCRCLL